DAVDLIEAARLAEAGMHRHVDVILLGERLKEGKPHERFAERAVEINEGRPLAGVHEDDLPAVDVDRLGLAASLGEEHPGAVAELFEGFQHTKILDCSPSRARRIASP